MQSGQETLELANELAGMGVLWDVVTAEHVDVDSLKRYRAVVYHDLEVISEAEAAAIRDYLIAGGVVVLSGDVGRLDGMFRMWEAHDDGAWPPVTLVPGTEQYLVGQGVLFWVPGGTNAWDVMDYAGQPTVLPTLDPAARERVRVAAWTAPGRLVVHLVNYDVPFGHQSCDLGPATGTTLQNVELELRPPPGWVAGPATIHSPEPVQTGSVPVQDNGDGTVTIIVPELHTYTIVEL